LVWRIEEAPAVEPFERPGFPAAVKPVALAPLPATARLVSPGSFAVSIARSGAAYADC
jgi:hypothetical protein